MSETETETTLATFNLQIVAAEPFDAGRLTVPDLDKRVLADLPAMLEAVEEDLSDLLPEGYSAVIKEWDAE